MPTIDVKVVETSKDTPTKPVNGLPTVVYWNICGLAQQIRVALVLAGVNFCDVRINAGDPKGDDYKRTWFDSKDHVGTAVVFPNLPYFLDGDVALSQSNAILRYIGNKYGRSVIPTYISDLVIEELTDLDRSFVRLAYSKGLESLKDWVSKDLPRFVPYFERLMKDGVFLEKGNAATIADIKLYEFLRKVWIVETEGSSSEKRTDRVIGSLMLGSFMSALESLPAMAEYMSSSAYLKRPLNNPHAAFK